MENVIQLDFVNKNKPLESIFKDPSIQIADARVLAYHLYDTVVAHEKHFFDNIHKAKHEVSEFNQNEFKSSSNAFKSFIGDQLERLYNAEIFNAESRKQINGWAVNDLTIFSKTSLNNTLEYFDTIGIPFVEDKVINIETFIGLKAH